VWFVRGLAPYGAAVKKILKGQASLIYYIKIKMKFVEKTKLFLNEVTTEMKKVSWSTRRELLASTWIVIVSVSIFVVVLGIFDYMFSRLITYILKQGFLM